MKQYIFIIGACLFAGLLVSCHEEPIIIGGETEQCGEIQHTGIGGFYLLNKATIDYYDYTTATYHRNIYPSANPNAVKELGDVGNDICIYGSRLYAVINASNKIEVMDASSTKRIGQIDIPNCRYLRFHDGYGYITSYAGPIQVNPNYEQKGYVARFDTATLKITNECVVGFQPDGLEIVGNKIYVAKPSLIFFLLKASVQVCILEGNNSMGFPYLVHPKIVMSQLCQQFVPQIFCAAIPDYPSH